MIGHNQPKAQGTFAKVIPVPSRGVYQFLVEIPDEQANAALTALGGLPAGGDARWVTIRLLEHETEQPRPEKADKTEGERAVTRAAILCNEDEFRNWLWKRTDWDNTADVFDAQIREDWEQFAIIVLRQLCGVKSRRHIATNPDALKRFLAIETEYKMATGRMASPR